MFTSSILITHLAITVTLGSDMITKDTLVSISSSTLFTNVYSVSGIHTYFNCKLFSTDMQPRKLLILAKKWLPFWNSRSSYDGFFLQFVDIDMAQFDMTITSLTRSLSRKENLKENFLFVEEAWGLVLNSLLGWEIQFWYWLNSQMNFRASTIAQTSLFLASCSIYDKNVLFLLET